MIKYKRNIPANYLFTLFSNIQFTSGLWMIFLAKNGFSLIELGLLESIFHISSMIFEIPSGALADLIGRKACRLAGRVSLFISLVIMYTADGFVMQAVGFAFCAFAYNLESGAGEAFIYDSLKNLGIETRYKKIAGIIEVFFQTGMIISFVIGGFLASGIGYLYVFLFSGCSVIISFFIGLSFEEPERGLDEQGHKSFAAFGRILVDSVRLVRKRPRIVFLIVISETILTFTTSLFFFLQNYFKSAGREESYIGIIYALASALSALSSLAAGKIEALFGERRLLIFLPILLAVCLWGIGLTDYMAVFFVITGFIEGVTFIVISDYLNIMIPSEIRATVLSFRSMAFSMIMAVLFPLIGYAAEFLSFKTAFLIMAVAATVMALAYAVFSTRFFLDRNKNQS